MTNLKTEEIATLLDDLDRERCGSTDESELAEIVERSKTDEMDDDSSNQTETRERPELSEDR